MLGAGCGLVEGTEFLPMRRHHLAGFADADHGFVRACQFTQCDSGGAGLFFGRAPRCRPFPPPFFPPPPPPWGSAPPPAPARPPPAGPALSAPPPPPPPRPPPPPHPP